METLVKKKNSKGRLEQAEQRFKIPKENIRKEKNKQPEGPMGHCQTDQCTFCGDPKKKGAERTFEEIMIENFPKLIKDMNINIQELISLQERLSQRDIEQDTL